MDPPERPLADATRGPMLDIVFLLTTAVFFTVSIAYVVGCDLL